jgi:hypothetical protein
VQCTGRRRTESGKRPGWCGLSAGNKASDAKWDFDGDFRWSFLRYIAEAPGFSDYGWTIFETHECAPGTAQPLRGVPSIPYSPGTHPVAAFSATMGRSDMALSPARDGAANGILRASFCGPRFLKLRRFDGSTMFEIHECAYSRCKVSPPRRALCGGFFPR